jgi:hypothetical protein
MLEAYRLRPLFAGRGAVGVAKLHAVSPVSPDDGRGIGEHHDRPPPQ